MDWRSADAIGRGQAVAALVAVFTVGTSSACGAAVERHLTQPVGSTHEPPPPHLQQLHRASNRASKEARESTTSRQPSAAERGATPWQCELPDTAVEALVFPTAGFSLHERGTAILDQIIACERVGGFQEHRLRIVGYCDPRGSSEFNQRLGLARAKAVERYLLRHGMPEERFVTVSLGESEHLGTGPESWYYDRRVEIHLVPASSEPQATLQQ